MAADLFGLEHNEPRKEAPALVEVLQALPLENNQRNSDMPKSDRTRIDYMPGDAALDALALAEGMFPALRTQALIDRLLITAVSALQRTFDQRKFFDFKFAQFGKCSVAQLGRANVGDDSA